MEKHSLRSLSLSTLVAVLALLPGAAIASPKEDIRTVTLLNESYQTAVLNSDVATMDAIVADDFVFYRSDGTEMNKKELLADARRKDLVYVRNECTNVRVRVFGDTAVVTASLREVGTDKSKKFDNSVEFSDVFVRTPSGWRYVVGHAWVNPKKTP